MGHQSCVWFVARLVRVWMRVVGSSTVLDWILGRAGASDPPNDCWCNRDLSSIATTQVLEIPFFPMRRFVRTCILLVCVAAVAQDNPAIKTGGAISPKWRVRIHDVIKDPIVPMVFGRRREYKGQPEIRLHFTDNSTLAVSFVTLPENSPKLAVREPSDSNLPMRLQAIFFDAASGKVLATPSWPTPVRDARIIAARDGKFVTLLENKVALFGSDLRMLKTLTLPMAMAAVVENHSFCWVQAS